MENFSIIAHEHAEKFSQASGIGAYFRVEVVIANTPLNHQDLSDPTLASNVVKYASELNILADRYIGLTKGDLSPHGEADVVGWAAGEQAIVVESDDPYVTAHEIGHTFGLCDEYSYSVWLQQDEEMTASGGCPNPYPSSCPHRIQTDVLCPGTPTLDGKNSIMGPSGLEGEYGFNESCLAHLQKAFALLVSGSQP